MSGKQNDVVLYGPRGHELTLHGRPHDLKMQQALRALRAETRSLFTASDSNRHNDSWSPSTTDINTALTSELSVMRKRSRWLAFNDAQGAAFVNTMLNYCVGVGFDLSMAVATPEQVDGTYRLVEREAFNDYVEDRFRLWGDDVSIDAPVSSPDSFYDAQEIFFRNWVIDGEILIHLVIDRTVDSNVPLVLELINPDQLDTTATENPANHNPILMGVELDQRSWKPVAYWVHVSYDRNPAYATRLESVRIPAEEMIHCYKRLVPRQVRGVPFLHAVMNKFYQLNQYEDAQIIRNKIAALMSVFVIGGEGGSSFLSDSDASDTSETATGFPTDADGNVIANLQSGIIGHLPEGYDMKSFNPTSPENTYEMFVRNQKMAISAGAATGMSYTALTRDTKGTSFAGGRQAENQDFQGFRPLMNTFARKALTPIFRKWMDVAVLSGEVRAPTYEADPKFWQRHEWKPGGWSRGINPLQEVNAAAKSMQEGITTLDDECSFMGRDWKLQLQKQGKINRERLRELKKTLDMIKEMELPMELAAMVLDNRGFGAAAEVLAIDPADAEMQAELAGKEQE